MDAQEPFEPAGRDEAADYDQNPDSAEEQRVLPSPLLPVSRVHFFSFQFVELFATGFTMNPTPPLRGSGSLVYHEPEAQSAE